MKKTTRIIICSILVIVAAIAAYSICLAAVDLHYFTTKMVYHPAIHLSDNYDENFQEIRTRDGIVEDLMYINEQLHDSQSFEYVERSLNGGEIHTNEFLGGDSFYVDNYAPEFDETLRRINVAAADERANEYYDLSLSEGEFFTEDDYFFPDSGEIQVLLGQDYKGIYKLNDKIKLNYLMKDYICNVKGFLAEGSSIVHYSERVKLDDYIMLPMEKFVQPSENADEYEHQFIVTLAKNNGVFIPSPDVDVKQIEAEIAAISKTVDLPEYGYGVTRAYLIRQYVIIVIIISIILCACVAGFILVVKKRGPKSRQ